MVHSKQGLVKKQTWTEEELAEAIKLLELCNAYEDLHIKLGLEILQRRPANQVNDFLYYENDMLVGLLSLDDTGEQDREMTGVVHPAYRRKGIFTELLAAAKEEARSRGIERLIIVCERFSRSGQAFVAASGAYYDFSEHEMRLTNFRPHGVAEGQELILFEKAISTDAEVIAYITAACFGGSEEKAKERVLERFADEGHNEYYLAKADGQDVGCLSLYLGDKRSGIYAFGILPQYRRLGYGRQMLEQLIMKLRAESPKPIELEVETNNHSAYALYHSCGFTEVTTYGYYNIEL